MSKIIATSDVNLVLCSVIFPNELGLIRDSHTLFMKELDDRIRNWKQYGIVGDIFTKLSSSYHVSRFHKIVFNSVNSG